MKTETAISAGGVVGASIDGRIKVNNTLEKRLELVSEQVQIALHDDVCF